MFLLYLVLDRCPNFSEFSLCFFHSKWLQWGPGERAMCCWAGATAPVPDGFQLWAGDAQMGHMSWGWGWAKVLKRLQGWPHPQPPASQAAPTRAAPALLCQGAQSGEGAALACLPAGAGWGVEWRGFGRQLLPARNSQSPWCRRMAPSHPWQSAPAAHSSGSSLLPLAACVSCHASRKPRGRETSRHPPPAPGRMRVRQLAEAQRKTSGQWKSPASARSCGESCVWAHPCHASPDLCLSLSPSPFWALQLPEVFALLPTPPCILSFSIFPFYVSPFLAPHLLLFHSSHTAFFPLSWENCSSRSLSTQCPVPFCPPLHCVALPTSLPWGRQSGSVSRCLTSYLYRQYPIAF